MTRWSADSPTDADRGTRVLLQVVDSARRTTAEIVSYDRDFGRFPGVSNRLPG